MSCVCIHGFADFSLVKSINGICLQNGQEVPENKRRLSTVEGIVIARRNAGLNSTFRIRRLVAGVGTESLFPL